MKAIRIGNRLVGSGKRCFVIAEAGSNHDGSLKKAFALIDAAAKAGADAIKFQLFRADRLYPPTAGRSDYLGDKKSIFDIIKSMELSPEWLGRLKARCGKRNILLLASVFDEESADAMNPFVPTHKIASYELTHTPLVRHVARLGKPILLSTGACKKGEIASALRTIRAAGNPGVILFQCTAKYPAPPASLNLKTIPAMAEAFGVPVGLSDHSADPFTAPIAAVSLGAAAIEKHFTLSRKGKGPDHRFSIEPRELKELIRRIRAVESALGDGVKKVHPVERELYRFARRSIFTSRSIRAGEIFSSENLVVLRNGKLKPGLPPKMFTGLLGKRCGSDLSAYTGVQKHHIQPGKPVEPIQLRAAGAKDARTLWTWRRDSDVIRNSLAPRRIPWTEHRLWFRRLLKSPLCRQWIIENAKRRPVGQVRVDLEARDEASIHVGIDKRHRGKGYGQSAIAAAVHCAAGEWGLRKVKAHILKFNRASTGSFRKAGFRFRSSTGEVETWEWSAKR